MANDQQTVIVLSPTICQFVLEDEDLTRQYLAVILGKLTPEEKQLLRARLAVDRG